MASIAKEGEGLEDQLQYGCMRRDAPMVLPHKFRFRVPAEEKAVEPDAAAADNDLDDEHDDREEAEELSGASSDCASDRGKGDEYSRRART